jgi:UDP-N-acetylmuramate--alanine ligase
MRINNIFFIGIAGTGMSALAQFMAGCGSKVSGSDRYFGQGQASDIREKLEAEGINCYPQDGSGIHEEIDMVVVSTAIEDSVPEVAKARSMGIPFLKRSELLAKIGDSKRTIAIGGTSGKSTTSAMLFSIMQEAGMDPGIISGAGLVSIMEQGKIGNAWVGGEWLIIEADESDGSIVQYHPEIGVLLNIDKDHQEIDELLTIFSRFRDNTKGAFIVNRDNSLASGLSLDRNQDFCSGDTDAAGTVGEGFHQESMRIQFTVKNTRFSIDTLGAHNMENALAAIAVAKVLGISTDISARALSHYKGIYRRHQYLGVKHGVHLIDDYGHNPVKCAASIRACQPVAPKLIAWFQPHGYGPTRFLKDDFIREISQALRPSDEIWMSEIFFAGGTAVKDISAADLVQGIAANGCNAFFIENRKDLLEAVRPHLTDNCVLLLMGARDPGLETFGKEIFEQL